MQDCVIKTKFAEEPQPFTKCFRRVACATYAAFTIWVQDKHWNNLETIDKGRCVQGKLEITSINCSGLLRSSSWYHCLHVHIRFSMASVRFLSLFSQYCPSSREDKRGGRKRNYCLPSESNTPSGLRMSMIKYLRIESVLIGYQATLLVLPYEVSLRWVEHC